MGMKEAKPFNKKTSLVKNVESNIEDMIPAISIDEVAKNWATLVLDHILSKHKDSETSQAVLSLQKSIRIGFSDKVKS